MRCFVKVKGKAVVHAVTESPGSSPDGERPVIYLMTNPV